MKKKSFTQPNQWFKIKGYAQDKSSFQKNKKIEGKIF